MRGWTKVAPPVCAGKGATWRHESGWETAHCGNQSAHYPYYLLSPEGAPTVSDNGHGFVSVAVARRVAEAIADGRVVTSAEGCAEGLQRVVGVNASGLVRRSALRKVAPTATAGSRP